MREVSLWIIISIIWAGGCGFADVVMSYGASVYHIQDYGVSITPPSGWRMDTTLSQGASEGARREHKDAVGAAFTGPAKVDPFGLSLWVYLRPPGPQFQTNTGRRQALNDLKRELSRTEDEIYSARELTVAGYPAVQVVACTAYESTHGCRIVHHVTKIFAPQADIHIQFNIWPELFTEYKYQIEQSLASIHVTPGVTPPSTPKCQESDMQVVEHHWDQRGTFVNSTNIKWETTLRNTSHYRCLVKISFQLLDQENRLLYNDHLSPEQVFEPDETRKIMGASTSIETKLLSQVQISRVVIINIQ